METTVEARLAELEARVAALEGRVSAEHTDPTSPTPTQPTTEDSTYWLVDAPVSYTHLTLPTKA